MKNKYLIIVLVLLFSNLQLWAQTTTTPFTIGESSFLLDGKPYIIRCGEMHFARIPKPYWRHRLQMAKAMGLNTVCAYLFWNMHEKQPDQFTWEGQSDAAAFCKMAKEEGLYVILRPGPYSCAEWEFGGFPWWLLQDKTIQLRTRHPYFMERCKKYLAAVGKQLAPLQIQNGGPITMVQVENEYGSYGSDTAYMKAMKTYVEAAGFTVPLFHCDGPSQLKNDHPSNLFAVVNFGSNPEANFKALQKIQPTGPLMCGEYYPGWFDSWGRPHHTGSGDRVVKELQWMLDNKASFSIYMAHGGTTFGLSSGANAPPFLPQTSSYDYDAPINEAGNATDKFYAIRKLFSNYLQPGETLPDVPAPKKFQSIAPFSFQSVAPVFKNLPRPVLADSTLLMEELNQGFGCVLYQTEIQPGAKATLQFKAIHDYALVYADKKLVGIIDRRKNKFSIELPERSKKVSLEILVEAMGRVNYGGLMHDRKGIHGPVFLNDGITNSELKNWKHYSIALGDKNIPVTYQPINTQTDTAASFYKASFTATGDEDTYLDLHNWNKGIVWVNGICLGRYWNIGPTQTMMLPGCWLKKGINEVIVFDLYGSTKPTMQGLAQPVLDVVKEVQHQSHKKAGQQWKLSSSDAHHSSAFEDSDKWQTAGFTTVASRYFCLEALNEFGGQPFTSVAEIMLLDEKGIEIPRSKWKIVYADSEELQGDDGDAANVFDLQFTSIWHTEWQGKSPKHPHQLVIDLGETYNISKLKLLPRQDGKNGRIKDYRLYFSRTPFPGL
ncbi:MAG: beta-galactosidase [Bacteroidota bacterium]